MTRVSQEEYYNDRTMIEQMERLKDIVADGGIIDIQGRQEGNEWVWYVTLRGGEIRVVRFPVPTPTVSPTWDAIQNKPTQLTDQTTVDTAFAKKQNVPYNAGGNGDFLKKNTNKEGGCEWGGLSSDSYIKGLKSAIDGNTAAITKKMPNPMSWGSSEDVLIKYGNEEGVSTFRSLDQLTAFKNIRQVPTGGNVGQVVGRTETGYGWSDPLDVDQGWVTITKIVSNLNCIAFRWGNVISLHLTATSQISGTNVQLARIQGWVAVINVSVFGPTSNGVNHLRLDQDTDMIYAPNGFDSNNPMNITFIGKRVS